MWGKTHLQSLIKYSLIMCEEWMQRGYKDSCWESLREFRTKENPVDPPWLGSSILHRSHRANLKRKDHVHYHFNEPMMEGYFWPDSMYDWRKNVHDSEDRESLNRVG